MFVDIVTVSVAAGDGGDGIVSFRHEKFVDKGGPDGGDGGRGGNVICKASRNENTLASFRYQKQIQASHGVAGDRRKRHGKSGSDLIVLVPVGTTIINAETGVFIADLVDDEQEVIIAKGGRGGFGNAHFTSSVRQAPLVAEKGEKGESLKIILEMKLVADVGLVGLPNAGKSTFLSVVSNAKPDIANYPFTTITPNLGVVDTDDSALLFADIPGLIEGASKGKGLGDDFLRHISRCSVLLHLIDSTSDDIEAAYNTVHTELRNYSGGLADKPHIIVLTKIELVDTDIIDMQIALLRKKIPLSTPIYTISARAHKNIRQLIHETYKLVTEAKQQKELAQKSLPVITLKEQTNHAWKVVKRADHTFVVTGKKIESFAKRTDYNNEHGIMRLRDIMKKMGITKELLRLGIVYGDKIVIGDPVCGRIEY